MPTIIGRLGKADLFTKMFTEANPTDEISALIAAFPVVLPMLPLIGTDWLNNKQAKKNS